MAPIRMGGIPRSYDKQLLVVGDAAGHVDPLTGIAIHSCALVSNPVTGEGIHTAMIAGKIAATVAIEMKEKCNFSLEACRAYGINIK